MYLLEISQDKIKQDLCPSKLDFLENYGLCASLRSIESPAYGNWTLW